MDWIAGLMTAAGFHMIKNHVDLLSGTVHAVPTRSTATATDAVAIIRYMCLRSCTGFPAVLVMDHDAKLTSEVFRTWSRAWAHASSSANAKVEQATGVIRDTLHAYANGCKDD